MKQLTDSKEKVSMQNILFIFITLYLYSGCSGLESISLSKNVAIEEFSCSKKAKPKSLQLLEQQYRCTTQK